MDQYENELDISREITAALKIQRKHLFFEGNNFPGVKTTMAQVREIQAFKARSTPSPKPQTTLSPVPFMQDK